VCVCVCFISEVIVLVIVKLQECGVS